MAINKSTLPQPTSLVHKSKSLPDDLVRFSFRHLYFTEKFALPNGEAITAYTRQLLDRLKAVSDMKLSEFRSSKSRSIRAHTHDWRDTTEPDGFQQLSGQLRSCEPWQFCLTANEHGRVHGLLIDDVFYVVWVDPEHALYP